MQERSIFVLPVLLLTMIYVNSTIAEAGEDSNKEDYNKIDFQDKSALNEKDYVSIPGTVSDKEPGIEITNEPAIVELRLKYGYFQKGKYIYYEKIKLENSDTKSFEILSYIDDVYCDVYARDCNQVYYLGMIIKKSVPKTFRLLNQCGYALDKKHAYFKEKTLEGSNPAAFKILKWIHIIAMDNKQVYYDGIPLKNSHHETFELIKKGYARDKTHVFKLIDGRNPLALQDAEAKNKENGKW